MTTFESLSIAPSILKALTGKGYTQPTPIQQQAIPVILQGSDIFGTAQTGTGKTAAFAIPILQKLSETEVKTPGVRALILAPTRELAQQIRDSFAVYGSHLPLKNAIVYGGVPQFSQRDALRKNPDILIATPGRLLDLMEQGIAKINNVQMLVLDEADRMLDMGFIHDIKRIISKMPAKRQTILFSATAQNGIKDLVKSFLTNPVHINVPNVKSDAIVEHSIYHVGKSKKFDLLRHVLTDATIEHALVFTRTKRGADSLVKDLNREGIHSLAIHGNKSQNERLRNLQSFKTKKIKILVATDVAARGIDVKELSHVINFDFPVDTDTYIHRTGRTGRAGASGKALTFMQPDEVSQLRHLHKIVGKDLQIVNEHPFANATASHEREHAPRFQRSDNFNRSNNRAESRPSYRPDNNRYDNRSENRSGYRSDNRSDSYSRNRSEGDNNGGGNNSNFRRRRRYASGSSR